MNSTPYSDPATQVKFQRLQRLKNIATGVLILTTIIFVISRILQSHWEPLSYLTAFTEAAMVGALADWFAVTALFRHPLGLKIPHTNLLAGKKENIGKNLGKFVLDNFLSQESIEKEVRAIKLSANLAKWLQRPATITTISKELVGFIPELLKGIQKSEIDALVKKKVATAVHAIDFQKIASDAVEMFTQKGRHQGLLNDALHIFLDYLKRPSTKEWITEKFKDNAPGLLPNFIVESIAERVMNALDQAIYDILNDDTHTIRFELDTMIQNFLNDLRYSSEYHVDFAKFKENLLENPSVNNIISGLWQEIQQNILDDIQKQDSVIRKKLQEAISSAAENFANNPEAQHRFDTFVQIELFKLIERNKQWLADHIAETVRDWDQKDISDKLELEIGSDLQYIRLNGTLVGGLVGLVLHILFEVLG